MYYWQTPREKYYVVEVFPGWAYWYSPIEELEESFLSESAAIEYASGIKKYRPDYYIVIREES